MTDKTKEAPARSALKLALEALECDPLDMALNPDGHMGFRKDQAITAIREALAEPSEALALVNKVDQEESSGTEQPAIKQDLTPEQPAPVAEPRKPQQEPVAWMIWTHGPVNVFMNKDEANMEFDRLNHAYPEPARMLAPLYTSPPYEATPLASQRSVKPWLRLTDEEVKHEWVVWRASIPRYMGFAKGIEAKLKAKNSP